LKITERSNDQMDKTRFFLWNLGKGLLWLTIIISLYFYAKNNLDFDLEVLLGPLYHRSGVIFFVFLTSEVVFGIIPPEFFMLWSLRNGELMLYVQNIIALSSISYCAGIIGYYIGSYFNGTKLYRTLEKNVFGKFQKHFYRYGGFIIVVAALTPLPFSGICMLIGAVKYSFRQFVVISMMRFVRFLVYGIIIWEANIFN
jgi:membrane protein YqaA with SNARE-associated domain